MPMTVGFTSVVMGQLANRKAIDLACDLSPSDRATLELARWYQLGDKPRAQRHLDYYLKGSGADLSVDTGDLLRQDTAVREALYKKVGEALEREKKSATPKPVSGVVPIPQATYQDQDWRNALGSVNLNYEQIGDEVEVSFVNVYRWHPTEKRVTQCVHQAAERLKSSGAKEYRMVGKPTRIRVAAFAPAKAATAPSSARL